MKNTSLSRFLPLSLDVLAVVLRHALADSWKRRFLYSKSAFFRNQSIVRVTIFGIYQKSVPLTSIQQKEAIRGPTPLARSLRKLHHEQYSVLIRLTQTKNSSPARPKVIEGGRRRRSARNEMV